MQFPVPIPVFGISPNAVYGYGNGTIYLQSLLGLNATNIHRLSDFWYVPGLEESIISKHWAQQHSLKTTPFRDENVILTSTSGSIFQTKSEAIDHIIVLPTTTYTPANYLWFTQSLLSH
jgi:hypothetical protein